MVIFEPQSDGSTLLQMYSQFDPKISTIAVSTENKLIKNMSKEWYEALVKYMEAELSMVIANDDVNA